jgi:hypothetical protein
MSLFVSNCLLDVGIYLFFVLGGSLVFLVLFEENVNGIKDDKEKIKENMRTIKEKLIQRINQVEKELTNKLDILVQENIKFQQDEISRVLEVTEEVELYLKEMLFIVEHGSEKQDY